MKKISVFGIAILALASCNMDFVPSDAMTTSMLKENPNAAVYTTDGIYALFKDGLPYGDASSAEDGNFYIRHYFQLTESRGDNVTISGSTTDPFQSCARYVDVDYGKNKTYTWWIAYKIINSANSNIAGIDLDAITNVADRKKAAHLLGENYFFRAIAHFHMVTLFAMPYVVDNGAGPGVPLRIGMDYSKTERATTGEVYEAIVQDLKDAAKYMDMGTPRGDASYVSAKAARALLSRVYLYMGDKYLDKCIEVCDTLIKRAPAEVKAVYDTATLKAYPKATWSSPETIWCIHLTYPDDHQHKEATVGAMYNTDIASESTGWGEWFWSDELIELFNRYKNADGTCADNRFNSYFVYKWYPESCLLNDGKVTICFPIQSYDSQAKVSYTTTAHVAGLDPSDGDYNFTYEGTAYVAKKETYKGYTRYFIDHNFTGDATFFDGKTPAYIRPDIEEDADGGDKGWGYRAGNYMPYMMTKFSGQDGQVTMSSPVFLRWGEVFLNRAEALARKGRDSDALDDVNIIRTRAGLPAEAMFTTGNIAERGYDSVLDVVLDERRMELCFEGQRVFDVFRNKKKLDRRYAGYHTFEVIDYTDPRIALLIPSDEVDAAGGDYKQNPRN